jgi:hypothetical protein
VTVFYPPHIEFSGQPEISIYAPTGSEPSAVIHWAGGNEHITGVAQADERIGIYLKAKEMLTGYRHAVANHAGIGEYVNGTGLPVAEDDGGDGDDDREPYCTWCGFTLDAAGRHLYPDDVIPDLHETELGWREPVGVPSGEDAQAAEVRRIGKLHTDGHITDAECQQMVDKVLFPHAALAGEQTAHDLGTDR